MTINISGYNFEGPFSNTDDLLDHPGVYVILDYPDKVIDVGQSEKVIDRVENHPRESCWEEYATSIYYAVRYIYDGKDSRISFENEIRDATNPPCGER